MGMNNNNTNNNSCSMHSNLIYLTLQQQHQDLLAHLVLNVIL